MSLEAVVRGLQWFFFGTMTRKGYSIAIILVVIMVFVDGWRWLAGTALAVLVLAKLTIWR